MADKVGVKIIFDYNNSFSELNKVIKQINNKKVNIKTNFGQVSNNARKMDNSIKNVSKSTGGFVYEMGVAVKRTIEWSIAVGGFYKILRTLESGFSFIDDLSNKMNEIRIVTGKTTGEVNRLSVEFNKIARDMKVSTKEIADASVTFFRQGLTQEQVMNRIRVATQAAKVANLDFAMTAELLTAATNSMNIPIERASDVFAYLGDSVATSYSEIATGFQKVGGTASALQIPFEKVASYIAVISANTRENSSSIGNSIKTLFARISSIKENGFDAEDGTTINNVAKALATVDIELLDSEGNFKRLDIVLDSLGKKWNTLDSRTQAYLATTIAGVNTCSPI